MRFRWKPLEMFMKWLYLLLIDIFYLIRHGSVKKAAKCIRTAQFHWKMLRKVWLSSRKILKYSPSNSKLTRVFYKQIAILKGDSCFYRKTPKKFFGLHLLSPWEKRVSISKLLAYNQYTHTFSPRIRFIAVYMNHEFLFPLCRKLTQQCIEQEEEVPCNMGGNHGAMRTLIHDPLVTVMLPFSSTQHLRDF